MNEIRNKVKESGIVTIDLGQYKPHTPMFAIDLAEQLWQGLVLKEKSFREWVNLYKWSELQGKSVFIHCSTDAIVPSWAYMLVSSKLIENDIDFVVGSKSDLYKHLILQNIADIDLSELHGTRIMVKGCSEIEHAEFAMCELMKRLQPIAKSIMYGEPCSAVPVFKQK